MNLTRRRPYWKWALAAVVVALGVGAWAWNSRPEPPRYVTAAVDRGPLVETVSANGTLNPVTLVSVGTQVSGTVRALHADFNDPVREGQVLLELDDRTYRAALRQSEANLRSAVARANLAAGNLRRAEELRAKAYVSEQELDQLRNEAALAEASRDLAQAQLDRDRTNLGYTVIRSPVSGVVVARLVDVGQTVAASFQTPELFQIAQDLSRMQIDTSFAEADIGRIRVGNPVRFTVDAFPERTFEGRVRQVRLNPTTVQNVVTYNVVVGVDNPGEVLMPGMTAYANVSPSEQADVLRVPNSALRFRPARDADDERAAARRDEGTAASAGADGERRPGGRVRTVYVLRDGVVVPVRVTLGATDRRHTAVLAGDLRAGERVITADPGAREESRRRGGVRVF